MDQNPNTYNSQGYGSEFEYDSEADRKRKKRHDLASAVPQKKAKLPSKSEVTQEYNKEEGRIMRFHLISMDAYARHKKFINDYLRFYGGSKEDFKRDTSKDRTDHDVIRENHRFLWTDQDDPQGDWDKALAKKYWDKLFKEYCITDLSRYKENQVAMRWRVEKEVVSGKGQFVCGERKCEVKDGLRSWEVNFGYIEHGQKKNALVKLRLCPRCSEKLNYHSRRKEVLPKKSTRNVDPTLKKAKKKKKHRKHRDTSSSDSSSEGEWTERPREGASDSGSKTETDDTGREPASETDAWSGPVNITEEKSRDEEFEDYFEDMFL